MCKIVVVSSSNGLWCLFITTNHFDLCIFPHRGMGLFYEMIPGASSNKRSMRYCWKVKKPTCLSTSRKSAF